jgi:ferredoxin-nitrite reductase
MPRDRDNPYGMQFRGREKALAFLHPYREIGELNPVEQLKLQRHPFEVAQAVIERYSTEGVDALSSVPGEMERLKWVGLYPQRQGGDAFMMRIKVPGGVLTAPQVREIGLAAEAFAEGPEDHPVFGNRYADITTRQTIQLHWLRLADIPRMWQRFWSVGLTTVQACGDSARNVCSCPVSGVDPDEVVESLPVARAISAFFTANREYANLPRKFKMAVTGCREDCARVEIDDIGLWPARRADGTLGFNVLVGGGLSDGERMASDIDVFVEPAHAVELTRAVAQLFGELGNREHRGLARMRYLVQELGPEGFRAELALRAAFDLVPAGEELTRRYRGDHIGVHPQRQEGLFYVGCNVPVGRIRGIQLVEAARLAETYGDGMVRFSPDQNFILSGVPEDRLPALLDEELLATFTPFPGPFTRGVAACTGSEFCRFAVVETKERALKWARALDEQLAPADGDGRRPAGDRGVIRLHFSGCSASCAQPQIADIGFRGDVAKVGEHLEEAVDVGLGGSLGPDAAFIDWVAGALPVTQVPAAVVRLVTRYQEEAADGQSFAGWARKTPNEELRRLVEGTGEAR